MEIVVITVIVIGAVSFEEQLTNMKASLDRLSKESAEKDA